MPDTCHFNKKSLQQRFFPVNIAKFLNTAFLIEHLQWLLLLLSTQTSNSLTFGVPKSSYMLKQTWSLQRQVCVSMYDL